MDKELLKKMPFYISVGFAFIGGLLFTILGDLLLKSGSSWLIGGVLLTFCSAICSVLSETFREKKIVLWILKGLSLALIVSFVGYSVGFYNAMALTYANKPKILVYNKPVLILMIILGSVSLIAQVIDIVLNAVNERKIIENSQKEG